METYDAYIVAPIVNGTDIIRNPNVIKIHEVINNIVKLHNIKVDIYSPANIKINSETESRKSIDSALCVIIIVPTEYMRKFMLPIAHTISRNKKLYVLLLDEELKKVQAGVIANGYENVDVDNEALKSDYFNTFCNFIISAKEETRKLNGQDTG